MKIDQQIVDELDLEHNPKLEQWCAVCRVWKRWSMSGFRHPAHTRTAECIGRAALKKQGEEESGMEESKQQQPQAPGYIVDGERVIAAAHIMSRMVEAHSSPTELRIQLDTGPQVTFQGTAADALKQRICAELKARGYTRTIRPAIAWLNVEIGNPAKVAEQLK